MLTTLAIHVESWLQAEVAAQTALREALMRTEEAVRTGDTEQVRATGQRLQELLATTGARESRRRVLIGKLATELGIPARDVNLTRLAHELTAQGVDVSRLATRRAELRRVVAEVVRIGRRLEAVAQYHQGLFEELYGVLIPETTNQRAAVLVDEEG
jgi:hypothetical protein